jgi:N-methylhydantoinase A
LARFEIGVDVGGTFTDCVLADRESGSVWSCKVLTTHDLPSRAIFDGFGRLCETAGIEAADVERFVHTTTLVGNAVIEHHGQKTALIATRGFRDVLQLRREYRYDLFENLLEFPVPLIPRALSFEVDERIDARGEVLKPLQQDEVRRLAATLKAEAVESIAVALIHSYRNPAHEEAIAAILAEELPDVTVSLSTRVLPQIREYERTSATAINAYVQPLVRDYLNDLSSGLVERGCAAPLLVVTSSGGTISADTAKAFPVQLVESGPAAGVVFAARLGKENAIDNLVAFDMGGTTAKVCIVRNGEPQIRSDLEVARAKRFKTGSGLAVGIPLFDLLEIGAGGGSIAQLDATGLVQVGPRSVGSTPGPACYGRGGTLATVTDANLVLGFLNPDALLGGERALDMAAARTALSHHLAEPMGVSIEMAAEAVFRIVSESMAEALRMRAVESNVDVRKYAMMAFGGGGGVHSVEIARRVGIRQVICPPRAGVFSAAGLLVAPTSVEALRSRMMPLAEVTPDIAEDIFAALEAEARGQLVGDGDYARDYSVDMSYIGQEYELTVPCPSLPRTDADWAAVRSGYEEAYHARYGRILENFAVKVVTWRLRLVGDRPPLLPLSREQRSEPTARRALFLRGRHVDAQVLDRRSMTTGDRINGPAVIEDIDTTILVPEDCVATCDATGAIIIDC